MSFGILAEITDALQARFHRATQRTVIKECRRHAAGASGARVHGLFVGRRQPTSPLGPHDSICRSFFRFSAR
jgi:hypothetical protein